MKFKNDVTNYACFPETGTEKIVSDLAKQIANAYNEALINEIEANTVIINSKYAKTSRIICSGFCGYWDLSPMLCGLKVAFADLTEKFAFALTKLPIKTEEELKEEVRKETAKEILDKVYECVESARLNSEYQDKKRKWVIDEYEFMSEFTLGALHNLYKKYGIELFGKTEQVENFDKLEDEE